MITPTPIRIRYQLEQYEGIQLGDKVNDLISIIEKNITDENRDETEEIPKQQEAIKEEEVVEVKPAKEEQLTMSDFFEEFKI